MVHMRGDLLDMVSIYSKVEVSGRDVRVLLVQYRDSIGNC